MCFSPVREVLDFVLFERIHVFYIKNILRWSSKKEENLLNRLELEQLGQKAGKKRRRSEYDCNLLNLYRSFDLKFRF